MDLDFAIIVTVTFFSDSVRKTPPCLYDYRPHFVVKGDDEYLGVRFIDGDSCDFDKAVEAIVLPVYEGVRYDKLTVHTLFSIMEGGNIVGEGIVTDIWNLE